MYFQDAELAHLLWCQTKEKSQQKTDVIVQTSRLWSHLRTSLKQGRTYAHGCLGMKTATGILSGSRRHTTYTSLEIDSDIQHVAHHPGGSRWERARARIICLVNLNSQASPTPLGSCRIKRPLALIHSVAVQARGWVAKKPQQDLTYRAEGVRSSKM